MDSAAFIIEPGQYDDTFHRLNREIAETARRHQDSSAASR